MSGVDIYCSINSFMLYRVQHMHRALVRTTLIRWDKLYRFAGDVSYKKTLYPFCPRLSARGRCPVPTALCLCLCLCDPQLRAEIPRCAARSLPPCEAPAASVILASSNAGACATPAAPACAKLTAASVGRTSGPCDERGKDETSEQC